MIKRVPSNEVDQRFFEFVFLVIGFSVVLFLVMVSFIIFHCYIGRGNHVIRQVEDPSLDVIHLPVSNESVTLISYFLKDMSLQGKNDGATCKELNHFSHNHPLVLFDGETHEIESCSRGIVYRSYSRGMMMKHCARCDVKPVLATTPFIGAPVNAISFFTNVVLSCPSRFNTHFT